MCSPPNPPPSLDEQKRIAGILDAADALRAKRREALAQLDTLLQSTFLDMFGDPVTNPMGWDVERRIDDVFKEHGEGPLDLRLTSQLSRTYPGQLDHECQGDASADSRYITSTSEANQAGGSHVI